MRLVSLRLAAAQVAVTLEGASVTLLAIPSVTAVTTLSPLVQVRECKNLSVIPTIIDA